MTDTHASKASFVELLMRFSPAAIALSLLLATVSSNGFGQAAKPPPDPRSQALVELGAKAQKTGDFDGAIGYFESALAIDPANRNAYIALAQVARAQGLLGKSIRLYSEALVLDPQDVDALAGQGEALVDRGAVEKAKALLGRIETICGGSCGAAERLQVALAEGPPEKIQSAEAARPEGANPEKP